MWAGLYIVTEDEGKAVGIREGWNGGNWLKNTRRLDAARQASLLFISINPPDILFFSPFLISRSRRADCGNAEENSSLSSAFPPKRKSVPRTCAGFLLHFLSRHCKLRFAVCICTSEENEGLQREHPFAAGFPIGARAALLAHDFAPQSLVCYTFASG